MSLRAYEQGKGDSSKGALKVKLELVTHLLREDTDLATVFDRAVLVSI